MPQYPKPPSLSADSAHSGKSRRATLLLSSCLLAAVSCRSALAQSAPTSPTPTSAASQDPDKAAPGASAPEQNQVSLYLALHDKKDRPLTNLKPTDLTITDAGRPVDSRELRISSDVAAGDHLITFIFDRLDGAGARNAARLASKVLKNLGDHPGAIAIWAIDDRLEIVQSYTTDRHQIENAIAAATTGRGKTLTATAAAQQRFLATTDDPGTVDARGSRQRGWDHASLLSLKQAELVANEQHVPWGIASLVGAAQAQRTLSGRKAILYFAEEIPADLNAADMLRAASERLKDASISVYAIDMNSLDTGTDAGMQAAMAMGSQAAGTHAAVAAADHSQAPLAATLGLGAEGFKAMNDTVANFEFNGLTGNKNLLAQFAESTGGGYTRADTDARKICHELMGDLTTYYTVTYPSSTDKLDGRYHAVLIKAVNSDIKTRAQSGYFAIPRTIVSTAIEPTLAEGTSSLTGPSDLDRLAESPSATDLTFRASALRFGDSPTGLHSVVALEVPINQLDLHEDPNTDLFSLHLSVAGEIKDASGKPVARFQEDFRRHGSTDSAAKLRTQFLSLERSVNLPAGDYQLEAIIRDWNTGRIGRTTQPLHLLKTADDALLSDLVLVRSTEEKSADASSAAIPMGHARVIPNLAGDLPADTKSAALYFQMYPQPKDSTPRDLRLEVSKDGKLIATLPMKMEAAGASERSSRVINVNLSAAGSYDLALCLDHGGHTTKRHISLVSSGSAKSEDDTDTDSASDAGGQPLVGDFGPPSLDLDSKPATGKHLSTRDSAALLSTAKTRALAYTDSLPNFLCVESIDRAIDHRGSGVWKRQDFIVELLRYRDKTETRTVLEINGQKSKMDAADIKGARSNGEFGGILQTVFHPSAAAEFKWEKSAEKNGETLQVYSYKIAQKNSQFYVTDHSGSQMRSAFHGLVFIDNDTRAVRRLIAETDPMPEKFGVKASWMAIDYDYIAITGHDYLLPTRGEVGLKQGKHESVSNQLRFTDYRRFGSHSRMIATSDSNQPQK